MNKVKEIILSWSAQMNPTPEQKKVAEIRLKTCMGCEMWTENAMGIIYCKLCGCVTRTKVFSPLGQEACPIDKWTI